VRRGCWLRGSSIGSDISPVGFLQTKAAPRCRGLPGYQPMADAMRLDLDVSTDTRACRLALARLQEDAGRFAAGTPCNTTSIRRWLTTSPRSVLFLNACAGVDDGACRSVQAAIGCVSRLEVDAGREVQIVQIRSASGSGTLLRGVSPSRLPWQARTEGRC